MLTPILGFETRGFVGLEHAMSWGRPMSTLAIWWGSCSADQLGIAGLGMDYREGWRAIVSVIERKTELVSGELQNDHLAPEWRSLTRIKQHILDQAGLRAVMHTLIITCNREIVFFCLLRWLIPSTYRMPCNDTATNDRRQSNQRECRQYVTEQQRSKEDAKTCSPIADLAEDDGAGNFLKLKIQDV